MTLLKMLPEDCLHTILSLASPKDVCSFSLVSSFSHIVANHDVVWEKFLPSDYREIMGRAIPIHRPIEFSSMKDLYFRLCDEPLLIDNGNQSFSLERSTGKKCYMLSAKLLSITWGDDPMSWAWISSYPNSRFEKTAYLRSMCWLGIKGKIKTNILSPNTTYGAYLVLNISHNSYGLDVIPSETSMEVGEKVVSRGSVYLCRNEVDMVKQRSGDLPAKREDGWLEVELGEVFIGEEGNDDEELKMSLMEMKGYQLKGGLVVQGIEIRPKYLPKYLN
ncbi:putative F-box protein PP2-B12 [Impatiens glandulifera]|uniref:putative F-box protein PP2-B12 n=1 Tax=Impatiens glandulifera TaxID=253017 RepID=UPI001FB19C99|nr:putative F-box protein PP2-B12 [Impatiens glandulifera]